MGYVPGPSETTSDGHLLNRMGESIGTFAARSGQRVQRLNIHIRPRGGPHMNKTREGARVTSGEAQTLPLEKAEAVIDTMQQRIALIASVVDLQSRRAAARVREATEDMLAEARQIRDTKRR
ncbi:hypothetical protein KDW_53290 [Dictyobacter vulcani]|uniref:Uncharacterized protein n=1 Tax=Dictyobacter vulcani TaxID=2607529 RepID=A0A5J4KXA7_9CHLR|nr:hypothetical protein [Dictyobacter vulcani]GER91167.1 hypothetical protein KDW_53290 [Dictyobacter vulcani]